MLTNILVTSLILLIADRRDKLSIVIIAYYLACIAIQFASELIYISDSEWFFINSIINLSIITALLMCYHQEKSKTIIFYTSLVVSVYVIPDIVQFYGFKLDGYDQITTLACLIEISIVGRRYVKRAFSGYNGRIKRWWSNYTGCNWRL